MSYNRNSEGRCEQGFHAVGEEIKSFSHCLSSNSSKSMIYNDSKKDASQELLLVKYILKI